MISYIITFEVVTSSFFALKYKRIKKNHSFESIFVLAFAIMSISHIGIGYSAKYWHIMLFSGIYGIGMAFIMSNNIVWLVNSVKSGTRGFWIGIMTSAIYLGKFTSPILLYPLVEVVGLSKSYVFAGVSMIFIAAFVTSLSTPRTLLLQYVPNAYTYGGVVSYTGAAVLGGVAVVLSHILTVLFRSLF